MALNVRIKRGVGDEQPPLPAAGTVRGIIRIWTEVPGSNGVPESPTDLYMVIGDDIADGGTYGEPLRQAHRERLEDGGWKQLLSSRGLSIEEYRQARSFRADLAFPAAAVAVYTG